MKRTSIGGQAVLEGVMMRSPDATAIAVRRENGEIVTQKKDNKSASSKFAVLRWPIIRGMVNFVEMLVLGIQTITDSARMYDPELLEDEKPTKAEEFIAAKTGKNPLDVALFFAVAIALVLAVGLFFILPNLLTGWITPHIDSSFMKNLTDGAIRLAIFFAYMIAITQMRDIKRLFGYHGAEHKVINCFEHDMPLDVEHAKQCSRLHPRCGTSFLLIVMTISIVLFSFLGWSDNAFVRLGLRLLMLPVVAGVSYEVLKLLARKENKFTAALRAPGMAMQYLSTREPDDEMLEAAIVSFRTAEGVLEDEEMEELVTRYSHKRPETDSDTDTAAPAASAVVQPAEDL